MTSKSPQVATGCQEIDGSRICGMKFIATRVLKTPVFKESHFKMNKNVFLVSDMLPSWWMVYGR